MENKLEQLFNSLIKRWRVPFGIYGNWDLEWERICIEEQDEYTNEFRLKVYWINVDYVEFNWLCDEDKRFSDRFSLRELVAKESWLWQFVCENGMIKKDRFTWMISPDPLWEDQYNYTDYRYRLIESALKDESELEQFLLDNIKL